MRALDLDDVMFGDGHGRFIHEGDHYFSLIADHPGVTLITKVHIEIVEKRLAEYKANHPGHIAQYPPLKAGIASSLDPWEPYRKEDYVDDPRYDGNLVRGEWLAYWLRWAIDNCENPVFVNR